MSFGPIQIFLVLAALFVAGCFPHYPHTFKTGDRVVMKLDGRQGQVVGVYRGQRSVDVRFSSPGSQSPYMVVPCYEYELSPAGSK